MNDEDLIKLLRALPTAELPPEWERQILAQSVAAVYDRRSLDAAGGEVSDGHRPPLQEWVRRLLARNPFTAGALAALWALIFFLRLNTDVDPSEKMFADHVDSSRPVYLVSLADQIRLIELCSSEPEQLPIP